VAGNEKPRRRESLPGLGAAREKCKREKEETLEHGYIITS